LQQAFILGRFRFNQIYLEILFNQMTFVSLFLDKLIGVIFGHNSFYGVDDEML